MKRIAIVGGGMSGISFFLQMLQTSRKYEFTIYEPGNICVNSSINNSSPSALCNTSIAVNSLYKDIPEDFLDYLVSQGFSYTPSCFAPRYLLTQYARERYNAACLQAKKMGCKVTIINECVERFSVHHSGMNEVVTGNGTTALYDYVCYSIGPCYQRQHELIDAELWSSGKVACSMNKQLYFFLQGKENISILGTKLSAIDTALYACARGIQVTLFSSSGLFPSVRTSLLPNIKCRQELSQEKKPETPLAFIKIINLAVKREKLYQRFHDDPLRNLTNDIKMAEEGRNTWESYIAEVIDYINSTLKKMNTADIKKIRNRTLGLISRYISSIPLENAKKILFYYKCGLIKVERNNAKNFRCENDKIALNNHKLHYDGLIIAAGIKSHYITKDNSYYVFTNDDSAHRIKESEFIFLKRNGAWLIGNLSSTIYPIVNYLKFCVGQTKELVDFIERKENESSSC